MKDFNNTVGAMGQTVVAIDAIVETSASHAYIVHLPAGDALPIAVHGASLAGQEAALIRVAADDDALAAFAANAQAKVEVVSLPKAPAARAKFVAQ